MKNLWKITGLFFLFLIFSLHCETYRLVLKVNSGAYRRENELVKAEIDFKRAVNINSFLLMEWKKKVPFYFVPTGKYKGELYWILSGITEPFARRVYYLYFGEGNWKEEPFGSEKIARLVSERKNLIPNHSFEMEEEGRKTVVWKGKRKPIFWRLEDYPGRYRNLSEHHSLCRLSEEEAYTGKKSLKIVSEKRGDKIIPGLAGSSIFPLKPKTKYEFSYYFKITDRKDTGEKYQAICASIYFYDENKKKLSPPHHWVPVVYIITRYPEEKYLGKWVRVEKLFTTPEGVKYGRCGIHFSHFWGTVYFDDLKLYEFRGEPVKIEVCEIEKIEGEER